MKLALLSFLIFFSFIARSQELMVPYPHTSSISNARFSPNGKLVVTASSDGTAKVWELSSGKQVLNIDIHTKGLEDAVFSNDGKLLATVSKDGNASIWDLSKGRLIHLLKGHSEAIIAVAFSPDGKLLITGGREETANIWDVRTGKIVRRWKVYKLDEYMEKGAVAAVSFSKDGKLILTGAFDGQCRIWETTTGKLIRTFKTDGSYVKVANFSNDGKYIIATEWSGFDAYVWEVNTGKLIRKIHGKNFFLEYAMFFMDNKKILTAISRKACAVYDLFTGKQLYELEHIDEISTATVSGNGKYIVTGSEKGEVKFFDAHTGILLKAFKDKGKTVSKVTVSADSKYALSCYDNGTAKVWDLENLSLYKDLTVPSFVKKEGTYFLSDQLLGIEYPSASGTFDLKNMEAVGGGFYYRVSALANSNKNYAAYSPNGSQYVSVFDRNGNRVLKVDGHYLVYPYQISETERYLFAVEDLTVAGIYEISSGKLLHSVLEGDTLKLCRPVFSKDDSIVIVGDQHGIISGWNVKSGVQFLKLRDSGRVMSIALTADKKYLISAAKNHLTYWDLKTQTAVHRTIVGTTNIEEISLDNSERLMIVGSADNLVRSIPFMQDVNNLEVDHRKYISGQGYGVQLKGSIGNGLYHSLVYPHHIIWDVKTGILNDVNGGLAVGESLVYHPEKQLVALMNKNSGIQVVDVWDLKRRAIRNRIHFTKDGYELLRNLEISPDGKNVLITTFYNRALLYDLATNKLIKTFTEVKNSIESCHYSPDGSQLIIGTNGLDYIYDVASGKLKIKLLVLNKEDYLAITTAGYYKGSKEASRQLHYVDNQLNVINFEQLDVKYNRPDKVLEAMNSADTALINSYRKAYGKRIKKLGIDTTYFQKGYGVPQADFSNRVAIKYNQQQESLVLKIKAADPLFVLDRLNVWINESPVFGMRGISLKLKKRNSIDTTIVVKLSDGENRIETSVTNLNGTESYRKPLYVNYVPTKPTEAKLYFVGIGINKFLDSKYNLKWSVKDIRDQALALQHKYGSNVIIDTLFDEAVTMQNITSLRKKLDGSNINDKVIIAYSGHGLLSNDYDYFLSTYNVNFDNPKENGLPYDVLESLIDGIPARKKLMLIDACHSGEVDKEELDKLNGSQKELDSAKVSGGKGIKVINTGSKKVGMKNSFELMQSLFINVSQSTGATVISAAAGTQFALEKDDLQNGVFSYSILEYMKSHSHAKVSELKQHVNKRVTELTNGLQVPTTRNETNAVDWEVW